MVQTSWTVTISADCNGTDGNRFQCGNSTLTVVGLVAIVEEVVVVGGTGPAVADSSAGMVVMGSIVGASASMGWS